MVAEFRKLPAFWKSCLILFFFLGSAEAVSVRTLTLAEMVDFSGRVFLGRVVGVEEQYDSRLSTTVTLYTFSVIDGIRGAAAGETIKIRQAGSPGGGYSSILGLPVYRKGEEILLFLHGNSRFGLTSPVGLSQGVFHGIELPGGRRGYVNGVDNRNLGLSGQDAQATVSSEADEFLVGKSSGAVPVTISMLRDFIREIEKKGSR